MDFISIIFKLIVFLAFILWFYLCLSAHTIEGYYDLSKEDKKKRLGEKLEEFLPFLKKSDSDNSLEDINDNKNDEFP